MKFALVSHVLPPSWSGQSVMIGRILGNIPPKLYCLISTENYQDDKAQKNTDTLPGAHYTLSPEPKWLRRGQNYFYPVWLRSFYRGVNIARIVRREKCTIIIAASGNLIDIPAGWWASVFTKTSFIPYLFDDYLYQWPEEMTRLITKRMEKRIYYRVRNVIVPNESMRDEIQSRHAVYAFVVRNPCASLPPINTPKILPSYDLHEEINIVYTGAIYHVNFGAFRNLIAATSHGSQKIKIHLYTAQSFEWLISNGVVGDQLVHHRHSVHAEVVEAQNRAHILFLPFSFDSSIPEVIKTAAPGKMGEYLASGIPILAHVPADSFVSWYFSKYDCGLVVDVNDVEMLRKAVLKLLDNKELRHRLGRNAQERARVDFDPEIASRVFMDALELAH